MDALVRLARHPCMQPQIDTVWATNYLLHKRRMGLKVHTSYLRAICVLTKVDVHGAIVSAWKNVSMYMYSAEVSHHGVSIPEALSVIDALSH